MLRVNFHHAIERPADVIDPERLRITAVERHSKDEPVDLQILVMQPGDRILHGELVQPVEVLLDRAFCRIREPAYSVGQELRLVPVV